MNIFYLDAVGSAEQDAGRAIFRQATSIFLKPPRAGGLKAKKQLVAMISVRFNLLETAPSSAASATFCPRGGQSATGFSMGLGAGWQ
jgi:hypothetical protein